MRILTSWRALAFGMLAVCGILGGAQLPLRRYTKADGLAHNAVLSIALDARGFLWFGTSEGLSRFDGVGFSNQTAGTGLAHRLVRQVLIGRNGNYWLATPAGLVRYRPDLPEKTAGRMVVIRPEGKPEAAHVEAILEDHAGRLWCGTETGLYVIEDNGGIPRLTEVPIGMPGVTWADKQVSGLAEDSQGGLWIGAVDGSLYRRLGNGHVERFESPEVLPYGQITHLMTDRKGLLWVGRGNTLYRSRPSTYPGASGFERLSGQTGGPPDRHVFDIFESREGDVWVGMFRCLAQFAANGSVHVWGKENGLPSRGISAIGQDRDGNLWMGTGDEGALKLAAGGILTYSREEGLGVDGVISIAETLRGELYIAGRLETEGFRIASPRGDGFDSVAPRIPATVQYLGWRPARVVLQDRSGEWWLASSQGLCRYPHLESPPELARTLPKAVYTTSDGLPGNVVVRLYEDRAGNIWLGTETKKIVFWSRNDQKFIEVPADGAPAYASAFGEDAAGNVWIGDEEGQLWRVRKGRAGIVAGPQTSAYIHDFLHDRTGRLWVATIGQGLLRFDHPEAEVPEFRQYGYGEGLSSVNVRSLAKDRNGAIYVGTDSGVDRLDHDLAHFRHYTSADGLASGQVNAAYCDRSGVMWFGMNHGLTRLVPQSTASNGPPPVWITGLSIAGQAAAVSEAGEASILGIEVAPGQEQLQFDFVGLSYAPGNVLSYQYRLGEAAWSAPIGSRSVHYGRLPPGRYRFSVRAINSDGEASAAPATVEFQVMPAIWRRAWFQVMLIALTMAAAVWVHRLRVARLLEIERVRTRIATDLHDDIGSSLSQIAILSEVAYQRARSGNSAEPVERIGTLSRELLDSIGDIVWAIQPQKDHLSDLRQRMRRFAADVLSARNVEMHWPAAETGRDCELDTELRRQVYLIFKESINNIARHSMATEAHITLRVVERRLTLDVRDNGCGMQSGEQADGNGLASMKLRAARLGGELDVRSAPGEGTTVRLEAPLPA